MWVADGGMSAVGGALVEDVALARHLADRGRRVAMLDGSSLLTVRMFESLADTWTGWGRSVALPGVEPLPRQLRQVAELAVTQAGPLLRLAVRRGDPLDVMLIACRLGTLVGTRRAYTRRDGAYWLSPLADVPAVARLLVGVIRPANSWRGRTYPIVRRPTASM